MLCATGYGINAAGIACIACATSLSGATLANWATAFYSSSTFAA
jgi:hypothetical protein